MLDWWNNLSLGIGDALLGWLLSLPADVTLFAVAIGSAAILAAVRIFTTDQNWLARAAADKKRLAELTRQAKAAGDKGAVKRHQATKTMIALKSFAAEGKPLVASILPIALLATWCLARLGFHPPRADEPVRVVAYTPVSAAGQVMHIVPVDGLVAEGGWVQPIEPVADAQRPHGMATWTLRGRPSTQPYHLLFRLGERTFEHDLSIGRRFYAPPIVVHDGQCTTELAMRPIMLFNVVPGIRWLLFPPWLVAYLIIVIPFVFILKRVMRIH